MTEHTLHPILHVVVIGFHHKKGCQVEYAYPPLIEGQPVDSNEVPLIWKNLPSLALPDGAHNFDKDTTYFHLPSQEDKDTAVYGVSCYRQIDAKDVVNKSSEVTRNSIQKCVCVLSRLPLFGVISAKLEMITYAWFSEKDFSQLSLLEETYRQLCASCNDSMLEGSQVFHGLSSRDLVLQYRHNIVMLFKLMLLERKVLVYGSPVQPVCSLLVSLLSLFPDMVEYGLKEATSCSDSHQLSQTLRNVRAHSGSEEDYLEIHYTNDLEVKKEDRNLENNSDVKHSYSENKSLHSAIVNSGTNCDTKVSGDNNNKFIGSSKPLNKSSHTLTLDSSPENGAPLASGGTTPCGGVREKSENEKLEKDVSDYRRETSVVDSHLCEARSLNCTKIDINKLDVEIDSVTRVETVQCTTNLQSDEVILEQCERTESKKDPLEFVEDITHVEYVQKEDDNSHKVITDSFDSLLTNGTEGDHKQNCFITPGQKDISDDNLAVSEGTASEFGTASNMEELLETEEENLDWQDDKLLLAIDAELGTPSGEPAEPENRVERMDSTTSWASQASSVASDLGEASVKVISDLKSKLTSMWDATPEDGSSETTTAEMAGEFTAADVPEVHPISPHQKEQIQSEGSSVDSKHSSPNKSNQSSPAKGSAKDNSQDVCLLSITPTSLKVDECGFPVAIFTKGVLCHPYLSLQYYDILQDVNVRGFLIGASNMLFKQKKHLLDAVIEIGDVKIDIHDELLRRQLTLTTADLRFAEYLVKSVSEEKGNVFLDETEWEGGDEWLRGQFKLYLASLLITVQKGDDKLQEDFNPSFIQAYKTTNNYRLWVCKEHRGLKEAPPGHPFQGQMSMQDVKMKFAHFMQGTEKGKKIMAAAGQTGKVAVQTGKAIGGAITSAKTTVTSWFSSIKKWSSSEAPED